MSGRINPAKFEYVASLFELIERHAQPGSSQLRFACSCAEFLERKGYLTRKQIGVLRSIAQRLSERVYIERYSPPRARPQLVVDNSKTEVPA